MRSRCGQGEPSEQPKALSSRRSCFQPQHDVSHLLNPFLDFVIRTSSRLGTSLDFLRDVEDAPTQQSVSCWDIPRRSSFISTRRCSLLKILAVSPPTLSIRVRGPGSSIVCRPLDGFVGWSPCSPTTRLPTHALLSPSPSWIPSIETSLDEFHRTGHDTLIGLLLLEDSEPAARGLRHPHTTGQYSVLGL